MSSKIAFFFKDKTQDVIAAAVLSGGFFALYLATLAPGLLTADNGEFQLVGTLLGVAHPPGFPLYTLLAYAATHLPLGHDPAWRINLLSAIISVGTLLALYMTTRKLGGSIAAALLAAATLGSATTFWAQATTANIRSLTAFFAALAILTLVLIRSAPDRQVAAVARQVRSRRLLMVLALTLSLGFTHHLSLAFMGLVFAGGLLWAWPGSWRQPRLWLEAGAALLVGLLPLLYLPWRAAANSYNAPADLTSWSGFWNHVLARGFRGDFFYFVEPAMLLERLRVMGNVFTFQFNGWLLLGMAVGLFVAFRQDRWLAFLLGGSWLIHTFITATYRAPQTVEYMLPAYVPMAICLGLGLDAPLERPLKRWLAPWLSNRSFYYSALTIHTAWLLLFTTAVILQLSERYPSFVALSQDKTARAFATPILQAAPPHALLLADWHWATPLWYLQAVEGARPDLEIAFVYPTAEPYEQTWARRIQERLAAGQAVVATHFHEIAYSELPPPEPLGEAFLFRQQPRSAMPPHFSPLALHWPEGLRLHGYQLTETAVSQGEEMVITVAWEMSGELPLTLFLHLVGFDGRLYAQADIPLRPVSGVGLTQFRLTPRPGTPLGELALFIGAYGAESLLADTGQERVELTTVTVVPAAWQPVTRNPLYRWDAEQHRTLIGYDWDGSVPGQWRLYLHWQTAAGYWSETIDTTEAVTLTGLRNRWGMTRSLSLAPPTRSHYVPLGQGIVWTGINDPGTVAPGQAFVWRPRLAASQPILRDLVVSVALIGYQPDGYFWAWRAQDDSVPAMGAMPTLKWIAGTAVTSSHWLTVDAAAVPGQAMTGTLILYDAFTQRPLPILDERLVQQAPWIPLPLKQQE
jgi:4-amino-4-deoxy-L-arabinose transferase-like glycosyltransferase